MHLAFQKEMPPLDKMDLTYFFVQTLSAVVVVVALYGASGCKRVFGDKPFEAKDLMLMILIALPLGALSGLVCAATRCSRSPVADGALFGVTLFLAFSLYQKFQK
jgi:hypothetical protein